MKFRWFMPMLVALMMLASMVKPAWASILPTSKYCGLSEYTDSPKVDTALGCVPVRIDQFMAWFLPYMFGIAGGISFLLMVYGFILMTMSAGDPKKVQGAQETISSAIMGLVVCIFAIFILRLVAVGILKIPGLN